ncbi:MAG: N-6 DNA methylase [Asgard group archaeon]|nr:N-6 DNA methylase [Asgard group archaeon]
MTHDIGKESIAFIETPDEVAKLMVSLISTEYKNQKEVQVLDSGCGRGVFLEQLLADKYSNIEGIELDNELIKICKSKFPQIKFYHEDYLDWEPKEKYDIIIGNPPYAHYNSLPSEVQEKVVKIVSSKESDIYYAFILKSIDLLKDGGELIYIVPYGFFYNTFAKIVRKKIISEGFLYAVIDLDEIRLFEGENPETIIFKFKKTKPDERDKTQILRIVSRKISKKDILEKGLDSIKSKESNDAFFYYEKPIFIDSDSIWTTYPEILIETSISLKEVAWIGVGLVSGFDRAFIISNEEIMSLNEDERKFIIRSVKASHCKAYWTEGCTNYILIPDDLNSEEILRNRYPNIYKKISDFKEKMNDRFLPSNKKWFQWQALRNYKHFLDYLDKPKIYIPTLDRSKYNRFSLSDEELLPSGDILTIVPLIIDPFFLLGYLNSNFFREYYLSAGARRGHRIAFTQRIMSNIQIPLFTKEVEKEIASITQQILKIKDVSRKKEIETLIQNSFKEKHFRKLIDK